jgi:Fe-S-cluster-containing hydrogenase component 2
VADYICRKERRLVGEGCDKPMETCLGMGSAADLYIRHGLGREISQDEALQILEVANQAGLVLQPGNAVEANFICCCCGDCCGVLRNVKRHPQPASVVSSGYYASSDPQVCSACGDCVDRCQMEAVSVDNGYAVVDLQRCIGCGLCVTTCTTGAMHLQRKAQDEQRHIPRDYVQSLLYLARQRGVISNSDLVMLMVKSKIDRVRSKIDHVRS